MPTYPKGSEWRKWDLHVHSSASANFGGTYDQIINQIEASDCVIIGVNDYCTISGYKKIIELKPSLKEKLLPVVEFRMNNTLTHRQNSNVADRINFQIIFNPYLNQPIRKDLLPIIETFVKSIKYKTSSGSDTLIGNIPEAENQRLFEEVSVDYFKVIEDLEKHDDLFGNYLIILPYQGHGGIDGIDPSSSLFKPALINKAHIIETANEKQISFFLWEDNKFSEEQYKGWCKARKPSIKGSDSHDHKYPLGKLKDNDSKPISKYCWIKADPTFEGLKQIVREPKDRVFIGETPPKLDLVDKNKTRYIKNILIQKETTSSLKDTWFNNNIEFNPGLVAIIGNKGKGKSALAETIGLLGNSKNCDYFSFLISEKFRKNKLANNFHGELVWLDGAKSPKNLMDAPDLLKVERVKCIPQNYLETLCNNLDKKFQEEIDDVVFSHIDETERIEKTNLKDLIDYKTQIIDNKISKIQEDIIKSNKKIIDFEDFLKPEYSIQINDKLKLTTDELRSHCKIKPVIVSKPDGDKTAQEAQKKLYEQMIKLNNEIKQIEGEINLKKKEQLLVNENIEKLKIIKGKIEAFKTGLEDLEGQLRDDVKKLLGVEFKEIIQLKIDSSKVEEKLKSLNLDRDNLAIILNINYKENDSAKKDTASNLYKKLKEKQKEKNGVQELVDESLKKYQKYIENLSEWKSLFRDKNAKKREFKKELENIKNIIPGSLRNEIDRQKILIKDLFSHLKQKVLVYETLYEPVIKFIQQERDKNSYMELNFSAEIMLSPDFSTNFLSFIDRNRKGSFQGIKESQDLLKEIIQKYDFSNIDNVINFLDEIVDRLRNDSVDGQKVPRVLENQLIKSKSALYAFLYLLRFLKIDYRLKWGGKLLEDLSPGERGTVLLIFYLLIDKSDIPLVIDQPEENLDNESIYYLLVRYIKQAKDKRQIFVVTHNPNLAVVCDAEQVVYCDLDKKDRYRVSYITGSIEDHVIKQKIIDVLEGTKPAFRNRQHKYDL